MFAVIFRATIADLDDDYEPTAERLRDLALKRYGCREFFTLADGNREVAISYWDSEDQIRHWKQDAEHLLAQQRGSSKWYRTYQVEVVEIRRMYRKGRCVDHA